MIKTRLKSLIENALSACADEGVLAFSKDGDSAASSAAAPLVEIDAPRSPQHGDYSTNVALLLARSMKDAARAPQIAGRIAEKITAQMERDGSPIGTVETAGGFINFRLAPALLGETLRTVLREGPRFGRSDAGGGRRVLLEFVSANPNGPVTVGHGRGGVIGDVLASLLEWTGHSASREFYVNDATNSLQMRTFARSVFIRYRQLLGHDDVVPDDGYPGEYVIDIARRILEKEGAVYENVPAEEAIPRFMELAQQGMQGEQEATLRAFGIVFDTWFRESSLHAQGRVEKVLEILRERGHAYEDSGALWLRSSAFGDDKDRVLVRADGNPTYIAGDLAYHQDKLERGFDHLVNVWGADHHGYIGRTRAGLAALGYDPVRLDVVIYQLVRLIKDGKEVVSSKRFGNILSLGEVIEEVGADAARFFFLLRSSDAALDFDVDLAKRQEKENPVYYAQYAHARCCSILRRGQEFGFPAPEAESAANLTLLSLPEEAALIKKIADLPGEVRQSAAGYAPHRIARYALDLSALFHSFYDQGNRDENLRFVRESAPELTAARLALAQGVRTALANALGILGVSAPERMEQKA